MRECGKVDPTKAGKLMTGSGKTLLFASHQFILLRNVLIRVYRDVQTFQYRAVADTFDTVDQMEKARTAYAEIYIPGKYGANFTKADVESRTIYQLYEEKLHMQLGRGKQTIRADRASPQAAKALQIPEGWPVLSIRRRSYNAQGELVEYMIMTYEYTQYSFDVELNLSSR